MAAKIHRPGTDASQAEYGTYAPPGEKCRNCQQPFEALEPCLRVTVDRSSNDAALGLYKHSTCPPEKPRRFKVRT